MQFYRLFQKQLVAKEWERSLPPPPSAVRGVSPAGTMNCVWVGVKVHRAAGSQDAVGDRGH